MERVHLNWRGSNSVGRGSLRLKSGAFYFPLQELEGVVACLGKVWGLNVHITSRTNEHIKCWLYSSLQAIATTALLSVIFRMSCDTHCNCLLHYLYSLMKFLVCYTRPHFHEFGS